MSFSSMPGTPGTGAGFAGVVGTGEVEGEADAAGATRAMPRPPRRAPSAAERRGPETPNGPTAEAVDPFGS
ncbi:hypothetical protein TSST111916_14610 [Tsukamurella strandjordii]